MQACAVLSPQRADIRLAGRVFAKMIVKFESTNHAIVADSVRSRSSGAALRGVIKRIR